MPMFPRYDICAQSFPQNRQLAFCCASVDEFEQAQALVVRDCDHWPERRIDSLRKQWCMRLSVCWRFAKNLRERVAKTALRFKAAPVSRLFHTIAFPHLAQGKTHPTRAIVRLERHSIMTLELSPRGSRVDRERGQFLVREAPPRRAFHFRAQALDQFRRTRAWIERVATQAGPIAVSQSVA